MSISTMTEFNEPRAKARTQLPSMDTTGTSTPPRYITVERPNPANAYANPAPLGLFGFALSTVLLNIHNAGFFEMNSMILGMGLCFGGGAQFVAGCLEFLKGNTFGFTAFCSYGAFWVCFCFMKIGPLYFNVPAPTTAFVGWWLLMWGLFTSVMFAATFKKGWGLRVIFSTLVVLFLLLAIADWSLDPTMLKIAGYEGIICGLSAFYVGAAEILEDSFKAKVLPY